MPALRSRSPLARWLLACTLGDALGLWLSHLWGALALPALLSAFAAPSPWLLWSLIPIAGALEGLGVGLLQALALRRWFPALSSRGWLGATVAAMAIGWAAGSALPFESVAPSPARYVLTGLAAGAIVGALVGGAQRLVAQIRGWVALNALGWALGMGLVALAASDEGPGELARWFCAGPCVGLATSPALVKNRRKITDMSV